MRRINLVFFLALMTGVISGCGKSAEENSPALPYVILAEERFETTQNLETGVSTVVRVQPRVNRSFTVNLDPAGANMTMSSSNFYISGLTPFEINDFGYLQVSSLTATDISVCGSNQNKRCNLAGFIMYTTGTSGEGLWSSSNGYGVELTAGQLGGSLSKVGLGLWNAALLQVISIPSNQKSLQTSDFPNAKYNVKANFTDAGKGTYGTTIVVAFFMALQE